MTKSDKKALKLKLQKIRELTKRELGGVAGGMLVCRDSEACNTGTGCGCTGTG